MGGWKAGYVSGAGTSGSVVYRPGILDQDQSKPVVLFDCQAWLHGAMESRWEKTREPASVGVTLDPKIHASILQKECSIERARDTRSREERYIGLDVHKHYITVGGMNIQQEIVLRPRDVEMEWFKI